MNWYKKAKNEFNYEEEISFLWKKLLFLEMDRSQIYFDTENDESILQKTMEMDELKKYHGQADLKYRAIVDIRSSGGDWQCPTFYARVEIQSQNLDPELSSQYRTESKLVCIPEKGNPNLVSSENNSKIPKEASYDCQYPSDKEIISSIKDCIIKQYKEYLKNDDGFYGEHENMKQLFDATGVVSNLHFAIGSIL